MLTAEEIKNLPENPDKSVAEAGKDTLLYVAGPGSTKDKPVWVLVGGQRNAPLKRSANTLDASHKSSGGWGATIPGQKSWSIDYSGLMVLNDDGLAILDACFTEGKQVNVKIQYKDKTYRTGWATVTEFDDDNAHDAVATVSVSLTGVGAITSLQPAPAAGTTEEG